MYRVNNREYSTFLPINQEFLYTANKNYLFDLSYLGIISIEKNGDSEFLQGQLSCDVTEISGDNMRFGALCNLKGRILALPHVVYWHGFKLIIPNDLLLATKNSLSKTAMFYKITLQALTGYKIFGFYLQHPDDLIPFKLTLPTEKWQVTDAENYCCYYIGQQQYIFIIPAELASGVSAEFDKRRQMRGSLAWHAKQLMQYSCEIYPESRGLFLPHSLNLHKQDYLSFSKGCYKGQEVIARMHYRGKLKHVLKLFEITADFTPVSGQKLTTVDGKRDVGEIIDFCPIVDGQFIVVASVLVEHPQLCLLSEHEVRMRLIS